MQYILDASYFFEDHPLEGELWTTEKVQDEVKDFSSRARFNLLLEHGMRIGNASPKQFKLVQECAEKSGDLRVLSEPDLSVVALGLSLGGTVVSSDFAVQNLCPI